MLAEEPAVSEDIIGMMLRKVGIRLGVLRIWCVSSAPGFHGKSEVVIW
jgi:hypothetical protein